MSLFLAFLVFAGLRGRQPVSEIKQNSPDRTEFNRFMIKTFGVPLDESWSFFSKDIVISNATCNACFALERSYRNESKMKDYSYMDEKAAENIILRHTNYPLTADSIDSIMNSDSARKPNVVLILMEGMTAENMSRFGYEATMTPFLDSIFNVSLSYSRFFSAGDRTQKGFFSVMSSLPVFSESHSMQFTAVRRKLISSAFKSLGYHTQMFVPHQFKFDYLNIYLADQPFDDCYDISDYDQDSIVGAYGPTDRYMYNFAFEKMDSLSKVIDKPVFTFLYSCTNHPPYKIPDNYRGRFAKEREDVAYFCDDQLRTIYNKIRSTQWGKDAMIVFVADHGRLIDKLDCTVPTCQNHIPLIFNHPSIEPKIDTVLGVQADVVPTLLSLLGFNYTEYNGMGIDLTRTYRDTICYCNDSYYIARTRNRMYLFSPQNNKHEIWDLKDGMTPEMSNDTEDESMDKWLKAYLQVSNKRVKE